MRSRARSIGRLVPTVVVLTTLMWSPAVGQIGGAINKAKKTATDAAVPTKPAEQQGCTTPQFDKEVLELTPDRISRVMQGVQATRAVVGPGGLTSVQLRERAAAAYAERDKLLQEKEEQTARYDDAQSGWFSCFGGVLDSIHRLRGEEAQKRLMALVASQDVAALQAVMEPQARAAEQMAAGDTAAANKSLAEANRALGFNPAKDSVEANRICKKPVKPAYLTRADSLLQAGNTQLQAANDLEQQTLTKGAEASGLGERQFAIARERIAAFVASAQEQSWKWCFSPKEREALTAKQKELKAMKFE
jgi:hypothetical protein